MRWFEKNTYGLVTQLVKGTGLILLLFLDVDRNGDVVDVEGGGVLLVRCWWCDDDSRGRLVERGDECIVWVGILGK